MSNVRKRERFKAAEILTLAEVPVGQEAKVVRIFENGLISKRLMEMGVLPGVSVKVIKTAPFGCPLEIRVRGYHLALRRSEAAEIEVIQ